MEPTDRTLRQMNRVIILMDIENEAISFALPRSAGEQVPRSVQTPHQRYETSNSSFLTSRGDLS
jgi:hypothetical protein